MWISITDEKKPKHLQKCLIACAFDTSDYRYFDVERYHAFGENGLVEGPHFSSEGMDGMRVTHWMEIPELP